jgi:osmotically-inducible protein OsmY
MPDAVSVEVLRARIEEELEKAGLQVAVEASDGMLILNGIVASEEARQAANDIAALYAPTATIDNQLEIEAILPTGVDDFASGDPRAELADSGEDIEADGGELEADFTDQPRLYDALEASGPGSAREDDPAASGAVAYVPPIDPVVSTDAHGQVHVLGGFGHEADDDVLVERSASDRHPGDEALADAVRQELAEDASTAELTIFVAVRKGVAHLRGQVPDLDDADNAESVAARVPGIVEVLEELDVTNV